MRTVIENDLGGAFNLAGPRLTWAEFMKILGAENMVWVDAEIFKSAGVMEFELPLFRPGGPRSGLMHICNQRARAAGLTLTDPEVTLRDMQAWISGRNLPLVLSQDRETELIKIACRMGHSA